MEMPTVRNEIQDEKGRTMYVVMAYRLLTTEELLHAMRYYELKHKRPKPSETVTIITTIGFSD